VVYVRKDQLRQVGEHLCVPLNKKATWINMTSNTLGTAQELIPMFQLEANSSSPERSATLLTERETEIAKKHKLVSKIFTLILGPEELVENRHITRVGVVMGLFAAFQDGALQHARGEEETTTPLFKARRLPPGVIEEKR
jgi:hypothetical protein